MGSTDTFNRFAYKHNVCQCVRKLRYTKNMLKRILCGRPRWHVCLSSVWRNSFATQCINVQTCTMSMCTEPHLCTAHAPHVWMSAVSIKIAGMPFNGHRFASFVSQCATPEGSMCPLSHLVLVLFVRVEHSQLYMIMRYTTTAINAPNANAQRHRSKPTPSPKKNSVARLRGAECARVVCMRVYWHPFGSAHISGYGRLKGRRRVVRVRCCMLTQCCHWVKHQFKCTHTHHKLCDEAICC